MKFILAALALLALVLWSRREPDAVEDWTHPSLDIFRRKPEPWPLYREGDDGLLPIDPWLWPVPITPATGGNFSPWYVGSCGRFHPWGICDGSGWCGVRQRPNVQTFGEPVRR